MPFKQLALLLGAALLLAVPCWAAPRPERAQLRRELKNNPSSWAKRERWIPLPPDAKPVVQERAELKTKCVNNCLVVRTAAYEERDGAPGIAIREIFHVAPPEAKRKFGPEEQRARQAFHEALKLAQAEFINRPATGALLSGALQGVARGIALDKVNVFRAGMDGMAGSLEDRYTRYLPPEATQQDRARSRRDQVGCGVKLAASGPTLLLNVVPGSPAAQAGLRTRDRLIAINGRPVSSLAEAAPLLEGEVGSRVRFEVERGGSRQSFEVTRSLYNAFPIQSQLGQGGVGVLRLPRFYAGSADDVRQAIAGLEQQNRGALRGLVLDLRDNPGGSRPEWVSLLNDFLPGGSLGTNQGQGGRVLERFTARPELARHAELPLVVLVNERSASASERVAGVLKDRGRALVVGDTTHGKDVGQTTHPLADGSSFTVTNVKFHLPSGQAPGAIQPHVTTEAARREVTRRLRGMVSDSQLKDPALLFAVLKLRKGELPLPAASAATTD